MEFSDPLGVGVLNLLELDFMTWMSLSIGLLRMRITVIFLLEIIAFFFISRPPSLCKVASASFGE